MLLTRVTLENIRSYIRQTIEFSPGKTLLAGDIGSGKTTILLAVEFALFGVLRGKTTGETLLRKGSSSGSVELTFTLDGKEYTIRRTLRQQKDSVLQETGFISENGVRTDLSAVELKSEVLNILGYPRDLLTKSKSLIYRYTVFTPQEEMKQILLEETDERIIILRKVFGIDKYQRITENTAICVRHLAERIRILEEKTRDLTQKETELAALQQRLSECTARETDLERAFTHAQQTTAQRRNDMMLAEQNVRSLLETRKKIAVIDAQIASAQAQIKMSTEQMMRNEKEMQTLQETIAASPLTEQVSERRMTQQTVYERIVKDIAQEQASISALRTRINESAALKEKIGHLTHCPLCEQDVGTDHKTHISRQEESKIEQCTRKIAEHERTAQQLREQLAAVRAELENLLVLDKKAAALRTAKEALTKRTAEHTFLKTQVEEATKQTALLHAAKLEAQKAAIEYGSAQSVYEQQRTALEAAQKAERACEVELNVMRRDIENIRSQIARQESDVRAMRESKKLQDDLRKIRHWLNEHFSTLVMQIEKQVFMSVYHRFNDLFKEWFGMLTEDDLLSARLDEEFTPLITQNGHDMDYHSLSGGEKTSLALAYRLALNAVINDLMTGIHTRDLLILDEPTDGFSDQQLDKMRDVLNQLHISQIIIVSHEQKIESYVDKIVRVRKQEHVSKIEV